MNTVTYAVIALITPAFNGSGQRRCDSPRGFGSWKRILRISVYGKTTTKIAITNADTQGGIGSERRGILRTPAFFAEAALDTITIRALRGRPLVPVNRSQILREQFAELSLGSL